MLKRTFTYTDYNGLERTEDYYFNLTETELTELQMSIPGGFTALGQKLIAANDYPELMRIFKDIILRAYGEKSTDGRRFMKSTEISDSFAQTPAFDMLFMEFLNKPDSATDFIKGCVPAKMAEAIDSNKSAVLTNAIPAPEN